MPYNVCKNVVSDLCTVVPLQQAETQVVCASQWKNEKNRFTLGLNAAENTHHLQKSFKRKLFRIKFRTKKSVSAYVYLPLEWN